MNPRYLSFAAILYLVCAIVGLIWAGAWFGANNLTVMQELTGYDTMAAAGSGGWAIIKVAAGFMTIGLPTIISFNWPYFEGEAQIIRWFLFAIVTIPIIWGLFREFLPAISGLFATIRSLLGF